METPQAPVAETPVPPCSDPETPPELAMVAPCSTYGRAELPRLAFMACAYCADMPPRYISLGRPITCVCSGCGRVQFSASH
eukprot:15481980-Alexandrium_andersonii.AAC.1